MNNISETVALSPPSAEGWDFGDYPYGLEPLTLPRADDPWGPEDDAAKADLQEVYREVLAAERRHDLTTTPAAEADLERLFWFRWIIGHHISFVVWRLLHRALARLAAGEGDEQATAREITEYVRGYSAMLLYTGSSTREIYNETIRPSMYRLHSTFSGTWSSDYAAVRSVFRGRRVPRVVPSEVESLKKEIRLSHQIHLGVASKLVVGGRSLLQHLVDNPATHQPRVWGAVFDCYFLTVRAPISAYEVAAQLLRRCKAVVTDLATNGLWPAPAEYPEGTPEELRTPEVLACEKDMTDLLLRVAGLAVDLAGQGTRRVSAGR